jgi:hypothetical protein
LIAARVRPVLVENKGWVESEAEAKTAVVGAYEELMRLARDAARQRPS